MNKQVSTKTGSILKILTPNRHNSQNYDVYMCDIVFSIPNSCKFQMDHSFELTKFYELILLFVWMRNAILVELMTNIQLKLKNVILLALGSFIKYYRKKDVLFPSYLYEKMYEKKFRNVRFCLNFPSPLVVYVLYECARWWIYVIYVKNAIVVNSKVTRGYWTSYLVYEYFSLSIETKSMPFMISEHKYKLNIIYYKNILW